MKEHDQRFKTLLREFFIQFLLLFFPLRAARFDLTAIHWHETELILDPPQGDVLTVDLLAELRRRPDAVGGSPDHATTLFHLEVESRDAVAQFPQRMKDYHHPIRVRHNKPVLPIALYLRVGRDGIGEETHIEHADGLAVNTFRYLYVGLPALDAERYVAGDNWLGVALSVLMRASRERKPPICAEALRRIVVESGETPYRKHLLFECVEAYSDLDDEQREAFRQLLASERYREVQMVTLTSFERGYEKGVEKGIEKGKLIGRIQLLQQLLGLPEASSADLHRQEEQELAQIAESLRRQLDGKRMDNGPPTGNKT
jgi:hypothetical protein